MWQWLGYGWAAGSSLVVIPLLTLLTLPVLVAVGRREHRFDLAGLAATGLGLHFFAAFYRMAHGADAFVYDQQGDRIAEAFRHFRFNVDPGAPVPGTGAMRIISGVVSVFTGANVAAKFLVFAWLGFIGCYLLYRAFVTAVPNADPRRYALLIFLWPSLAFWPSSIGKDCWMLLTLGIASVGAARVLVRRPGGYTLLVLGLLLGSFVRPHVSLMALLAFGVALLVSRRETSRPGVTPSSIAKVAGLLVLIVLGGILASRAATVLDVDDFSSSSVNSVLETNRRTEEGGSTFSAAEPQNPLGYVEASFTILFRPLPTESSGAEQIVDLARGLVPVRALRGVVATDRVVVRTAAVGAVRDVRGGLPPHLLLRVRHHQQLRDPGATAHSGVAVRVRAAGAVPLEAQGRRRRRRAGTRPAPMMIAAAAIAAFGLPSRLYARRRCVERRGVQRAPLVLRAAPAPGSVRGGDSRAAWCA